MADTYGTVEDYEIDVKIRIRPVYENGPGEWIDCSPVAKRSLDDGRCAGMILENTYAFYHQDRYDHVDETGYDLRTKEGHKKIEVKTLGKYGVKCGRSSWYGVGRTPDLEQFAIDCHEKDFVIIDSLEASSGRFRAIHMRGTDILQHGHAIGKTKGLSFFGDIPHSRARAPRKSKSDAVEQRLTKPKKTESKPRANARTKKQNIDTVRQTGV